MWLGSFASFMALNMQMITRGWLVLRLADDSPLSLSLVMVSFAAPMTFVSLIGGALADRIPRKRMVMFSQTGNAILALLVATLDITDVVEFWHLLVLGVLNGSLMAFNMPSRQAIISDTVPEDKLMNAISLNNSAMNLTRILGPALAGILILYIDTAGVFFLISGIYVFATLSIITIDAGTKPASSSRRGMTGDIREGLAYVVGNPTLLGLILMGFIASLFGFSYFALLPAWGREALDVGSADLGILMMLMGIGALVGTLILAAMSNIKRRGALLLGACVIWGVSLALFSQATSFAIAVPLLLVVGLVSSLFMSLNMTLIQVYADREMRGRVMSIMMMTFGLMPLSALPFGALAEWQTTPFALTVSGILLAVFTLIFIFAYPRFRRIQ
jgi:MFS family permease